MNNRSQPIYLTTVDQVVPQIGRLNSVGDADIALFKLSDGRITAIENFCPLTKGSLLDGTVSGEHIYEPMREY
ncbi:Rieske 2Fe-2S domain-containing protein [Paraliobacillus ryukyuensis]|uniref:Rieske 2Fe-2S domain-containing protein n=1 Tax=Paraliobacillus ryukyuensis TaxID=200904 RepID=UPI000DE82314|nr:Rieske 2Fe-2S domain-containing protein [Paraliobacillus ryukyuensis]